MEPILRTAHLTFTYPGEEHPSLGALSLELARGSFVAILGHNGSGKSTILYLICRNYEFQKGQILIDGVAKYYREAAFIACKDTPIVLASLGNDAGIYGAAKMLID